jgi:hypothetical protein
VLNLIHNSQTPASRRSRWFNSALIFLLTLASTGSMMLCPCDTVSLRDHYAISLVAVAALFAIAATVVLYRRMSRDSGTTGFLRAVIALAIVGISVFVELFIAQAIVARMAAR